MATFEDAPGRPELYRRFEREVPAWFRNAKLGTLLDLFRRTGALRHPDHQAP